MIRDSKLQGYIERVNGVKKPITADIFLTDYCNEKCAYCRYAHKTGKYMKFEDFVKYSERLIELGVQSFILTGGGEPTINPDFNKITDYLEGKGIAYGVNTNMQVLRKCHPVFMKISIDTGDSGRYKVLRGVDGLTRALKNIEEYCNYRRKENIDTKVGVQCVCMDKEDVISFYEAIKMLDVDYIYFRPYEGKESKVTAEEVKGWLGERINDARVNISYKFNYLEYHPNTCVSGWSVICVNVDGDVPYCCHRHTEVIGSVLDNDILEKKAMYIVDMKKCETPCRLSGSNYWLKHRKEERDEVFV